MKTISAIAVTALLLSVGAVSAQTPSSGASQPGSTTNTDKEVPAKGVPADKNTGSMAPGTRRFGSVHERRGHRHHRRIESKSHVEQNPDPEVPGKKQ